MDFGHGTRSKGCKSNCSGGGSVVTMEGELEEMADLRRGPWTVEEDLTLVNYITVHGEGRWNSLASHAGLKRTGKSCRLRWLNYLRPDVRRGNITPEEQLLILQLHSRWGNRWSKIAQHLPGRTDNEIKNYWRTRVQKHAKQLKCDVNSQQFKDVMQHLWIPRLMERIRAKSTTTTTATATVATVYQTVPDLTRGHAGRDELVRVKPSPESSMDSMATASHMSSSSPMSDFTAGWRGGEVGNWVNEIGGASEFDEFNQGMLDLDNQYWGCGVIPENFWTSTFEDDIWSLQQ